MGFFICMFCVVFYYINCSGLCGYERILWMLLVCCFCGWVIKVLCFSIYFMRFFVLEGYILLYYKDIKKFIWKEIKLYCYLVLFSICVV